MLKSLICLLILAVGATAKVHEEIYGCCTKFFVDDASHKSWDEANEYCKSKGAHLAVIEAGAQQTSIEKLLDRIGDAGKSVWIGLRKVDGEWRWTDSHDSYLAASFFTYWASSKCLIGYQITVCDTHKSFVGYTFTTIIVQKVQSARFTYQYLLTGQPSGDGPSAQIYRPYGYKWNDVPSNWNYPWTLTYPLCEKRYPYYIGK